LPIALEFSASFHSFFHRCGKLRGETKRASDHGGLERQAKDADSNTKPVVSHSASRSKTRPNRALGHTCDRPPRTCGGLTRSEPVVNIASSFHIDETA
jgi:hypothetical protein